MFRLTKQTDYAILLMAYMANNPQRLLFTARELADETRIPAPMVTKILKVLSSRELLLSHRGAHGGYRLGRLPREIPILEVIDALEGPVSLTACSEESHDGCELEPSCLVRGIWQVLNGRVREALSGVRLSDMAQNTEQHEHRGGCASIAASLGSRTASGAGRGAGAGAAGASRDLRERAGDEVLARGNDENEASSLFMGALLQNLGEAP
jgi:FeS assembly SUF system regulator